MSTEALPALRQHTCLSVCQDAAIVALAEPVHHRLHHVPVHLLTHRPIHSMVPAQASIAQHSKARHVLTTQLQHMPCAARRSMLLPSAYHCHSGCMCMMIATPCFLLLMPHPEPAALQVRKPHSHSVINKIGTPIAPACYRLLGERRQHNLQHIQQGS